jgi:UDP-N-acetylmuramate dehydrogenase
VPRLADFTTLRLGGSASTWIEASTEAAFISALSAADEAGEKVLILGGGSNLVVGDEGFDGTVIRITTTGVTAEAESSAEVLVTVAAGENWDAFVAQAVSSGWIGVETLAGIPGTVGATPMQNVGAYGQEVGQTIAHVRVWDRRLKGVRTFTADECGFGYRWSRFKADPGRHAILSVTFRFIVGTESAPVAYAELARTLGVEVGERAPLADVRDAVLGLRRGKGMVLDADDHDTWSAGSFFTNPFVEEAPDGAPAYPQPDGRVKTSAAWLIERSGFAKGYGNPLVSLSTKHTLALTNRGEAKTEDLLALAGEIRDGVSATFGIELEPEPIFLNCSL